jgi:hypothetical protein
MPTNLTLYTSRPLTARDIEAVSGPHRVERGRGDELATIHLAEARVVINVMPVPDVEPHRAQMREFIEIGCDVLLPGLATRLDRFVQVLGLVVDPEFDQAGAVDNLVFSLADRCDGMVFNGQTFFGPDGTRLASLRDLRRDENETEDDEPVPPTPERVLARGYTLAAVAMRAFLDDAPSDVAGEKLGGLRRWVQASGLADELEPGERQLLDTPHRALPRRWRTDASWRSEGLVVLAWALHASELPDHETQCDPQAVSQALGFLQPVRPSLVSPPRLRSAGELEWMQHRLLAIHWRFRELSLSRGAVDMASFARRSWFGGFDLTGIPLVDGDLAISGLAITKAEPSRVARCSSIAMERHGAINWLLGDHRLYSEVSTST